MKRQKNGGCRGHVSGRGLADVTGPQRWTLVSQPPPFSHSSVLSKHIFPARKARAHCCHPPRVNNQLTEDYSNT